MVIAASIIWSCFEGGAVYPGSNCCKDKQLSEFALVKWSNAPISCTWSHLWHIILEGDAVYWMHAIWFLHKFPQNIFHGPHFCPLNAHSMISSIKWKRRLVQISTKCLSCGESNKHFINSKWKRTADPVVYKKEKKKK